MEGYCRDSHIIMWYISAQSVVIEGSPMQPSYFVYLSDRSDSVCLRLVFKAEIVVYPATVVWEWLL